MMSDFETTTRHEEHYQEKNKELERKLKQKNQTMLTALNSSNQAKMAEKKKKHRTTQPKGKTGERERGKETERTGAK